MIVERLFTCQYQIVHQNYFAIITQLFNQKIIHKSLKSQQVSQNPLSILIIIVAIIAIIVVFLFVRASLVYIPPGHVGVIYDRGKGVLVDNELPEGLHLKYPFWQISFLMNVQTQKYIIGAEPDEEADYLDDSMKSPTADGQTMMVEAEILFRVDHDKAADLFEKIGSDYIEKIVRTISRNQIRNITSTYNAIDISSDKREEAELKIYKATKDLLVKKDIILEKVLLLNITILP